MRFGILALMATELGTQFAYAQSLNCSHRQSQVPATAQNTKITIADVELSGKNPLSDDARTQLLKHIAQLDLSVVQEGDDSDWLAQIESLIQETLQKQGYFQVLLSSTPYLIRAEAHGRHYVVNVEIDGGPQYRLDEIHFSGGTVFAEAELRAQFSLHHVDLFDVSELRKGMDSMESLYSRKGFIDMVPRPEINIDVKNLLIDVLFKVDEGKQYHVRDVEIHGIDPQAEQALKSQFGYGQVFDVAPFRNFFEEHKGGLPTDVSLDDAIQVRRDLANASVDIVLDFRPCPKM
jgi:outer membrane protein assembly factor BamA